MADIPVLQGNPQHEARHVHHLCSKKSMEPMDHSRSEQSGDSSMAAKQKKRKEEAFDEAENLASWERKQKNGETIGQRFNASEWVFYS